MCNLASVFQKSGKKTPACCKKWRPAVCVTSSILPHRGEKISSGKEISTWSVLSMLADVAPPENYTNEN